MASRADDRNRIKKTNANRFKRNFEPFFAETAEWNCSCGPYPLWKAEA
jgi:hypothetical protein